MPSNTPRSDFIQMLRFIAAALVLVTHTTFYYSERVDTTMPIWHFGEIGVPIFFAISGVVMVLSTAKLSTDPAGAREFMMRRLLRIVPLYWLVTFAKIAIAIAVPAVVLHNHFDPIYAIKSLLFVPAYNSAGEVRPIHGVGWTLLHEMFFYLVFAIVMAARVAPAWGASLAIVALYGLGLVVPPQGPFMFVATHEVNLNFVVGMLIGSAILRMRETSNRRLPVLLGAGLLTAAALQFLPLDLVFRLPLDASVLVVGSLMLALSYWQAPAALGVPVRLGDSSYALYLFHPLLVPPILLFTDRLAAGLGAWPKVVLVAALAVALAHAVHLWIERPLNRWASKALRRGPALPRAVNENP